MKPTFSRNLTKDKILQQLQKKTGDDKTKRLNTAAKKQVAARRKEYNSIRKDKLKAISAKQKNELKAVTARLKTLPKKGRAAAGKKLRAEIRARFAKLKTQMPTSSRKSIGELTSLMRNIKVLRV